MTRQVVAAASIAVAWLIAGGSQAAVFNNDPASGRMTLKVGGLHSIEVTARGGGSATLAGTTLTVDASIWATQSHAPDTSMFTGVPLISDLLVTFANGAGVFSSAGSIPNPVGPGTITGIVGFAPVQGQAKIGISGTTVTVPLSKIGAASFDTFNVAHPPVQIDVTVGPYHTGVVTITNITSNVILLPDRSPPISGIAFSLDPTINERIKTFTVNGSFATQWVASHPTVVTTINGGSSTVNGFFPPSLAKVIHTVTVRGTMNFPTAASGTGTITVVTPMRINTGANLVNSVPGVLRQKYSFVPEPGTILLLVAGSLGLVLFGRSRLQQV